MHDEKVFVANASREFIAETHLRLFGRAGEEFFTHSALAARRGLAASASWKSRPEGSRAIRASTTD